MTNEEWKKTEEILRQWKIAELFIDNYKVQLQMQQDKMELVICVYVNGKINYKWLAEKSEEIKKFWCESQKSVIGKFNPKNGLSKKEYEQLKAKFPPMITYSPYFKSFRTLKSQFIKRNNNIDFLGEYKGADE